jgi:hypothetical protein
MGYRKTEHSTLASRLVKEYRLLRLIETRRRKEGKPQIGRAVEERIIRRNLDELEE